jgi:hypothetical protein
MTAPERHDSAASGTGACRPLETGRVVWRTAQQVTLALLAAVFACSGSVPAAALLPRRPVFSAFDQAQSRSLLWVFTDRFSSL